MYGQAMLGEEELGVTEKPWYETLGAVSANLLQAGSQIYALETQKSIEQTRLEAARVRGVTAAPSTMLQPAGVAMTQPTGAGFPILPVAIGAGALGVIYLILSRKKGRK